MLKFLALLISFAYAQAVDTSHYLVMTNVASAQARSMAQCQALGCDGVHNVYWWEVVPLTNGQAALRILGGIYGNAATIGPCAVGCGLTIAEIASLQTRVQLGTLLATPVDLH